MLPPIPTEGWTVEDLDDKVAEVREQYLETLANWSGRSERPVDVTEAGADDGAAAPPAAPLDWGVTPEMNPLETAMWRAEVADPRLRSNVTLLEILDPAPDWERLRGAHEWASRMVPRMRQRVVEPAWASGRPRWVTMAELDLDRHLHRVRLEAPGSMRQLLDVVGEFASAPLDRERPLWEVLLRRGPRGRARGLRRQDPPQHHRRPRRRPADEHAAQPDRRARPVPARAARSAAGRRLAASAC